MISQNTESLRKFHPKLLSALGATQAASNVEMVESRRSGRAPSLVWIDRQGTRKYLHSPVDPEAEAQKWARAALEAADVGDADPAECPDGRKALLIGHGMGYEIRAVSKLVDELWIMSANLPLLRFLCDRVDLSDIFADSRIRWLFGNPDDIQKQLMILVGDGRQDVRIVIHPPFLDTLPPQYACLLAVVQKIQSGRETEDVIRPVAEENFRKNVPALDSPGVSVLFGKARGRPVVVAGAGPTLDGSLEVLRQFHPRAYFVAADTVLKGLYDEKLKPDVVVSVDPRPDSGMHFKDMDFKDTLLVFTPITHPDVVRKFEGRRLLAIPKNHFFLKPLEKDFARKGILMGGASVSILASSLAAAMEPAFVFLAGIDFRAGGGLLYSRLSSYHRYARTEAGRFSNPETLEYNFQSHEIQVTDQGAGVPRMRNYAIDFRHVVKQSAVPFYSFGPAPVEGVRGGLWPCVDCTPAPRPIQIPPETDPPAANLFEILGIRA